MPVAPARQSWSPFSGSDRAAPAHSVPRVFHDMIRVFLIVLGAGLVVLAVAVLFVGIFPPKPHVHTVQHAVPTSALGTH